MLRAFDRCSCCLRCSSAPPVARAAEPVDLLLVLAADVSRSVDQPKFQLQREGYAAAIADKRVLEAITSGRHRRIAVCFVEWSGVSSQKLVIDWTVIDGPDAARKFGDQLVELPRSFAERTSISGGIDFAMSVLARAPYQAARRTIDVSGDGTNNSGRDVTLARDEAVAAGRHDQRAGDPERPADGVESRAHQSARRAGELLPRQRHRRTGRLRDGGGGFQLVRPGDHQEADRRDRATLPLRGAEAASATTLPGRLAPARLPVPTAMQGRDVPAA